MWWLGRCPNHHIYGSLLRARGFFITLLGLTLRLRCRRDLEGSHGLDWNGRARSAWEDLLCGGGPRVPWG